MSIEIDTKNGPITVFQVYALDSSYSDICIDMFYEAFQVEINNLPRKNTYFILGDFNAKIGRNAHNTWPTVAGRYIIGDGNARGERLL